MMKKYIISIILILSMPVILLACTKDIHRLKTSDASSTFNTSNNDYKALFDKLDSSSIKQIDVENSGTNKMKIVTNSSDIMKIVNHINKLRFNDISNDETKKPQKSGNNESINYRIIIGTPNSTNDDIILNINKNNVFYRGKWYKVNQDTEEDYISSLYKELKYKEFSNIKN